MLRLLAVIAIVGTAYADEVAPPAASRAAPSPMMQPPPPPPPPPPQPPRPSAEVAALTKQVAGSYACKGVQFVGNGASTPLAAKLTIKPALAGTWLEASLAESKLDGLQFDDFRTFDGVARQWTRIQMASTTGHVVWTSLGDKGGTWTWEGTATSPTGAMQVRDYEVPGDRQLKLWGEALLGGSWQKLYEVTCKR